jgi:hypothetical protein
MVIRTITSIFESTNTGSYHNNFANSFGIQYCGTINNRWKLYKDQLFPTNKILLGYRGDSHYESGFFFCPHVLLQQTKVILDQKTFEPIKGLIGKSGYKMVNPDYYAILNIENFLI